MSQTINVPRELLQTVLDPVCSEDWYPACKQLRALLDAPRQPEGEGLEVRATEEHRLANGGVEYYDLCRLSDAQRAIAELREECERLREENEAHLEHIGELGAAGFFDKVGILDGVIAERDTLRQQLAERDADAERWRYTQHPDYFYCGPYDTDGDYCGYSVGVLKHANGKQLSLNRCIEGRGDSLEEAIDAALAEVDK